MNKVAITRFEGFADIYDKFRPHPPSDIAEIIIQAYDKNEIDTVVDLGSGTGLSSRMWVGKAKNIIGIEPNDEMRKVALVHNENTGIEYRYGTSYDTRLPDCSVDIVACSQSFHWMEPSETLREMNRILKPSGVFAAFDNDWPPFVNFHCDLVFQNLLREVRKLLKDNEKDLPQETQYSKEKHLENIRNSGFFTFAKGFHITNKQMCDKTRFINLALSQGALQTLRKSGVEEIEKHIMVFTQEVENIFSTIGETTMWTSYSIRVGVKN